MAGKLGVAASMLNRILTGLGACPTLTVLLRRMIRTHLRRSRPEKFLNVFQRIHLRLFPACGLRTDVPLSPRHEGNVGQAPRRISPEMALRLSKVLDRSAESWLAMQSNYDLWQAKQHVKLGKVGKVRLTAA